MRDEDQLGDAVIDDVEDNENDIKESSSRRKSADERLQARRKLEAVLEEKRLQKELGEYDF